MTRKRNKNNKSGITGVSYEPKKNRWKACIMRKGIYKYNYFGTKEAAIEWRIRQEDYYRINGRFNIIYDI